jgi:hypothetical protein
LTATGIYALMDMGATDAFAISIVGYAISMPALAPGLLLLPHRPSEPVFAPQPIAVEARRS